MADVEIREATEADWPHLHPLYKRIADEGRPGRGSHIATASFMVDPDRQGGDIGLALGEHVVDWACDAGYHAIQFNAGLHVRYLPLRERAGQLRLLEGTSPQWVAHATTVGAAPGPRLLDS